MALLQVAGMESTKALRVRCRSYERDARESNLQELEGWQSRGIAPSGGDGP